MVDIGEILRDILRLHPEFSLKIGQKAGALVVEMRIAGYKPALAMGSNLVLVLNQAHGVAVRNIADRLLAESRLSDAVFDNAVSKLEGDPCHCCGCDTESDEDEDDDEYYEECSDDFDDSNN
jgi:hypothetical protein